MSLSAQLERRMTATECGMDEGQPIHVFGENDRCQCGTWDLESYHALNARRWNGGAVTLGAIIHHVNQLGRTEVVHVPAGVNPERALVTGLSRHDAAGPEHLAWIARPEQAHHCNAGILVSPRPAVTMFRTVVIECDDPKLMFAQLANRFFPEPVVAGVHPSVVLRDVTLGKNVTVGPGTCIKHATIGDNVRIGANCTIGQRGFGYVRDTDGRLVPFPQVGRVVIESDVDIANNVCIDRGALGDTVIKRGAKIDNLVHIAHNCVVGEDALVIAGSVLCGGVVIGDRAQVAPQAVVREQRTVGARSVVGLGAVVVKDVPAGVTVMGNPAR